MRVPRDEWPSAESREDAAVVVDAGREVGARADDRPGLNVRMRQREHAGRAGGAAGLVHALDLRRRDAEVAPEWRSVVDRVLELLFRAERKPGHVLQPYAGVP